MKIDPDKICFITGVWSNIMGAGSCSSASDSIRIAYIGVGEAAVPEQLKYDIINRRVKFDLRNPEDRIRLLEQCIKYNEYVNWEEV
jgi:hypothetical protein